MTTFSVPLLISIAGVEAEYDATVTGTFQRAHPAYTPRGEMAPTDPSEPASFEIERITIEMGGRWAGPSRKHFDVDPVLSEDQFLAIEEQGIEEAGNDYEAGREAAAEAREEMRREDMRDRYLAEFGE